MTREAFDRTLQELRSDLLLLGEMAEHAIKRAVRTRTSVTRERADGMPSARIASPISAA